MTGLTTTGSPNYTGYYTKIGKLCWVEILVNANGEIVGTTWSLPTSNYDTQPNTWVKSLNSRLKRTPTWEFAIGRMPALP